MVIRSHQFRRRGPSNPAGFTLIELLVVITIIGLLVSLSTVALQNAMQAAATTRAVSDMRSVVQACMLYSNENNGQINVIRDGGDPLNQSVRDTFWGNLQPFLFPNLSADNDAEFQTELIAALKNFYKEGDLTTMPLEAFAGAPHYTDSFDIPVAFACNDYLYENGQWTYTQRIEKTTNTAYLAYGYGLFDENDADTYVELPRGGIPSNNIYFMKSREAILGFLDGHVEVTKPPVDDSKITL